jgi:hypothetical protein
MISPDSARESPSPVPGPFHPPYCSLSGGISVRDWMEKAADHHTREGGGTWCPVR